MKLAAKELTDSGAKFLVFATEINGSSSERLTLHGIGPGRSRATASCAPWTLRSDHGWHWLPLSLST